MVFDHESKGVIHEAKIDNFFITNLKWRLHLRRSKNMRPNCYCQIIRTHSIMLLVRCQFWEKLAAESHCIIILCLFLSKLIHDLFNLIHSFTFFNFVYIAKFFVISLRNKRLFHLFEHLFEVATDNVCILDCF